jgi:hypothetical protein
MRPCTVCMCAHVRVRTCTGTQSNTYVCGYMRASMQTKHKHVFHTYHTALYHTSTRRHTQGVLFDAISESTCIFVPLSAHCPHVQPARTALLQGHSTITHPHTYNCVSAYIRIRVLCTFATTDASIHACPEVLSRTHTLAPASMVYRMQESAGRRPITHSLGTELAGYIHRSWAFQYASLTIHYHHGPASRLGTVQRIRTG